MGEDRGGRVPLSHFLLTASGRDAIDLALAGVPSNGEVWITSSVGTALRRISPCVAQAVSRRARFAANPSDRTVGIVLVHEWGFPHPDRSQILDLAHNHGWRVVDDCAHAFVYGLELAQRGATVAFSLPKFFPVTSGGILAAPDQPASSTGRGFTMGAPLGGIGDLLRDVPPRGARHVANWQKLKVIAESFGFAVVEDLPDSVVPQVFRLAVRAQFAAQAAFHLAGIETAPPFYAGWLALPCHADLPSSYWDAVERAFHAV